MSTSLLIARQPEQEEFAGFRLLAGGAPEVFLKNLRATTSAAGLPVLVSGVRSFEQRAVFCAEKAAPPAEFSKGIGFLTSGSTGEPRAVWKSDECLVAETERHAELFANLPEGPVLALVPPWHLYGFLFSVLLPARLGRECVFSEPGVPTADQPRASLVVAVPALFQYVEELAQRGRVAGAVVFSGAPLGEEKRARWRQAFGAKTSVKQWSELCTADKSQRALEVIGSTETGGLGVSCASEHDRAFTPLPGVSLRVDGDGVAHLRSPFVSGGERPLDDRLTLCPDGRFEHAGRRDLIFKFAGKRHSLTEVEARLAALLPGAQVRCFFREDDSHSKGGVLHAFLAGAPESSLAHLRESWRERGELPFPQEFHFRTEFARDALGKITFASLLAPPASHAFSADRQNRKG